MMDTRYRNRIKALLEARRTALALARLRNVHDEDLLLAQRESDVLDRGADRTAAAVLDALAESERHEVMRIDAALERMEADTWGICTSCGDRIEDGRLEAIPEALRCIDCETATRPDTRMAV